MCGIAGILSARARPELRAELPGRVRHMTELIAHRGPDGDGVHVEDAGAHGMVALGHRRLAIIDLGGSAQPFVLPREQVAMVYNGELYNYRELREELVAAGHAFHTQGDTEVFVRGWLQWGEAGLSRFDGMFAAAIWDARCRRLTLVRDAVGIKPLYWAVRADMLVFGSELKCVMASGVVGGDIDPDAVHDFFANGYIVAPRTPFVGVHKLAAGGIVHAEVVDDRLVHAVHRWWQVPAPSSRTWSSEATRLAEVHDTISRSVRAQLVADVPVGAFLSGGIDSSLVVALMREHSRDVHTFSVGFDDPAFDESPQAELVAKALGTTHHQVVLHGADVVDLPGLLGGMDEPLGDPSLLPTLHVCKLAREHVTVVLSGDGGDELFGGYARYAHLVRESQRLGRLPGWLLRSAALLAPMGGAPESRLRNLLERVGLPLEARYARFRAIFSPALRDRLLARPATSASPPAAAPPDWRGGDELTQLQLIDLLTYLPDDVLAKVDRMSMSVALEVRVPLLSVRVIALALALPPSSRLFDGITKATLRTLVDQLVPGGTAGRGKKGFGIPLSRWLRGELSGTLREALEGDAVQRSGWFHPGEVRRLWSRHRAGAPDTAWPMWQLLAFAHWYERALPGLRAAAPIAGS